MHCKPRRLVRAMAAVIASASLAAFTGMAAERPAGASLAAFTGMAAERPAGAADAGASSMGTPARDMKDARTIDVEMGDDMRFRPQRIVVREGETVRFRVRNAGKLEHEFVMGTPQDIEAHATLMRNSAAMDHAHMHGGNDAHAHDAMAHQANALHVDPGKTGTLAWRFTRAGEYRFACLVPGHYEAGMTGALVVEPR